MTTSYFSSFCSLKFLIKKLAYTYLPDIQKLHLLQISTYIDLLAFYKLMKEQHAMIKKYPKIIELKQMKTAFSRKLCQIYGNILKDKKTELYD